MKKYLCLIAMVPVACWALTVIPNHAAVEAPTPPDGSYQATVHVTDRVVNTVKPLLFGDNIEWTNDGMGFWLPKAQTFDEKLIEEVHAAGVTHLRYPGGSLSDYFEWSKAIGDRRQPIPNPFAKGKPEDPRFGPAEFMALCRKLHIPGTITLNAGTAKPEDAASWVKYFRDHDFPVTAFAVGNEIYMAKAAEPIAKTPEQYIAFYQKCRAAIENVAPGTPLGIIGIHDTGAFSLSQHPDWMEKVLRGLGGEIRFIDVHNGYAPATRVVLGDPKAKVSSDDDFAACFMGASVYVEQNLQVTKADLARYAPEGGKNIEIHITEYGPLVIPGATPNTVEDAAWNRSLAGALYQACLFNFFTREPKLTSANHLPLHQDLFGALIGVHSTWFSGQKRWRNIVFHVFQMYARMSGRDVLAVDVESPTYSTPAIGIVPKLEKVPCLDVGAFRTSGGDKLALFLINRDVHRSATVKLDLGTVPWRAESVTTLTGATYKAENSPSEPDKIVPVTIGSQESASVPVPKHSLVRIDLIKK